MGETDKIIEWLEDLSRCHAKNMGDRHIGAEAKCHRDACNLIADGIRRKEYMMNYRMAEAGGELA